MFVFFVFFEIVLEVDVFSVNVVYFFGVWQWFDDIICYNNLSMMCLLGCSQGVRELWQNVIGCSLQKGIMFIYVDWIVGKNMWFVGGDGIGIDDGGYLCWYS